MGRWGGKDKAAFGMQPDAREGAAGGSGIWNSPRGPYVVTMASAGWTCKASQSECTVAVLGSRTTNGKRPGEVGRTSLHRVGTPPPKARHPLAGTREACLSLAGGWPGRSEKSTLRSLAARDARKADF